MMKNRWFYALNLLILSALLCCCTEEDQGHGYTKDDMMEFESTINGEIWSRANSADNGQWQGGEKVAIKIDKGELRTYTASSSGLLTSDNPFLWLKDNYHVIAYYPTTKPSLVDQSTEAKYQACHVVRVEKNNVSPSNNNLVLEQQMAKLIITLSPGENVTALSGKATVRVLAPTDIGSYVDGKIGRPENYQYITAWNKGNNTYHALVPPHTTGILPNNDPYKLIEISIGDKVFYYSLINQSWRFDPGSILQLNVKVHVNSSRMGMRNWMQYRAADDQLISSLSIPGTHDSGAAGFPNNGALGLDKCQDHSIKQQLENGVRYLDIRVKVVNNIPMIYHGNYDQHLEFESVIIPVSEFLKANPSEFVMMQLKEEGKPTNSSKSTYQAIREVMDRRARDLYTTEENKIPKVGDVRGKIVVFKRDEAGFGFKLNFADNKVHINTCGDQVSYIQDAYEDGWQAKQPKVETALSLSSSDSDVNKLYLNFVSCTGGLIPNPGAQSAQLNWRIRDYIRNRGLGKTGVVLFDFYHDPGNLAVTIAERNLIRL